jgi:hypothetical protein
MKTIQLELQGFEKTEKPEPSNMNDKAKNIFLGFIYHRPEFVKIIKAV